MKIALIGVGEMGREYTKVLKALGAKDVSVIGRSTEGCSRFYEATGVRAIPGGLAGWLKSARPEIDIAIVAVSVEELAGVSIELLDYGVKRILLEKPAGLNSQEIGRVKRKVEEKKAQVIVGYNRRFYASVLKAQEIIREDGGVLSFHFEFTEWPHTIIPLGHISAAAKASWFLANSSHVADLAFFLGGKPERMTAFKAGGCDWHPSGTVFTGAGISKTGAMFSYCANWDAPGRWGVEIMTRNSRLIFRPIEKLQIQRQKSVSIEPVDIDYTLDTAFKPGLYLQTKYFIEDIIHHNFIEINNHLQNCENIYMKIINANE
ncbi:MAG: hypothetical protein A2X45_02465 [Lentisphaerae bacterium GWF2_50_93]|nr:MAG: hypothetical protein A2X45_02465 [Lentisphaerae bacterium GWF2_50_93]